MALNINAVWTEDKDRVFFLFGLGKLWGEGVKANEQESIHL